MKAFIDEYGDANLKIGVEGVSHYYILCAILVADNENEIRQKLELLSDDEFSGGEMKSSNIGNNHKRRIIILNRLNDIPYYAIALIIDKELLYGEGLARKSSFFKFFNGRLYQLLLENYPDVKIYHDEYGTDSYMREFENYVNKRYSGDLFDQFQDCFLNSKNDKLIQLADLLAGSIAKSIDTSNPMHKNIASLLTKGKIYTEYWPSRRKKESNVHNEKDDNLDKLIEVISYNAIIDFIELHKEDIDEIRKLQVLFLKYLINVFDYISKSKYTFTSELIENLSFFKSNISIFFLRTKIVAPLRDEGIPIASTNQGYKIPCRKKDIVAFINHTKGIIEPMQNRLRILYKKYSLSSQGKIDLKNGYGLPPYIE